MAWEKLYTLRAAARQAFDRERLPFWGRYGGFSRFSS